MLDDEGLLGDDLLAAHLHEATPEERERLAEAGVWIVGCPSSITAVDGVVPPIVEYHDHGGTVGLGTDQAPGPGGHNALREVRTAAMLAKTDRGDPTALDAAGALKLATIGGARAVGIADRVGSLSPGNAPTSSSVTRSRQASPPRFKPRSTRRSPTSLRRQRQRGS